MKIAKEYKMEDVFISSIVPANNYYNEKFIVCGKNKSGEFKLLLKFDMTKIKSLSQIKDNIKKIELCLYLSEIKLDQYTDSLMINIGKNLQNFKGQEVCYSNSPRINQENCMYIVKKVFKNKYVNFNITDLAKSILNNEDGNYGLTMLAINERGIAFFNNSRNDNSGFIKITYEQDVENNNCSDKKYIEKKINNNPHNYPYGYFINDTGRLLNGNNFEFISWDKNITSKRINIGEDSTEIIIKECGIYQVDYSVNLRSGINTYMCLLVNGQQVNYSKIELGLTEQFTNSSLLLVIIKSNSIIKVAIKKVKMILVNKGIAASLRLVKIDEI